MADIIRESYAKYAAENAISKNTIIEGLSKMLLEGSSSYESISDLSNNIRASMLNLIDTTETPKTVGEKQIIATMLFKNMVFDNPDFFSKLSYLVLTELTRNFADGIKQYFMPAEVLCLNYAWICFLQTNLNVKDTQEVFNPSLDPIFELPFFISKNDQEMIKELISKFSTYEEKNIYFLSFSPYNSLDYSDFSFENTPNSENGDIFLLSLIPLLYYYNLMITKNKQSKESKDESKKELGVKIAEIENRIDSFTNYLNDFSNSLPNAADILNTYKPKDSNG
ncbi:hypothetical protein [Campylobacter sp. JMF_03 NE3]|uniref:hypothetical protein n=1 Tax=Campylobacter sp. JMF_03 NE3 TaxID=2983831 RepID=UPI0022E9BC08|nr:hypothetical protein [Campylobacter sp. JMF_03 NE3]MDA3053521.1 hypothetical protein [Campylobacter sp. JMF_03 NE3]